MPRIAYKQQRFSSAVMDIIYKADQICREYAAQGFRLTIRQLYYQFVARGLLANKSQNYQMLIRTMSNARLAGYIDWNFIEDRTRFLRKLPTWANPQSIIEGAADQYRRDLWKTQPIHFEVWIEKDALIGVIEQVCDDERVSYFACRGYVSQSEIWEAAQRYLPILNADREVVILHLGDHDPSGIDMTRDIEERVNLFVEKHTGYGSHVSIKRLALNMDQVEQYDPPPNPAKWTDSRAADYISLFGEESWELDALEPAVIRDLIADEIAQYRDDIEFETERDKEDDERDKLRLIANHYPETIAFLNRPEHEREFVLTELDNLQYPKQATRSPETSENDEEAQDDDE